jgi:hypothetical protein
MAGPCYLSRPDRRGLDGRSRWWPNPSPLWHCGQPRPEAPWGHATGDGAGLPRRAAPRRDRAVRGLLHRKPARAKARPALSDPSGRGRRRPRADLERARPRRRPKPRPRHAAHRHPHGPGWARSRGRHTGSGPPRLATSRRPARSSSGLGLHGRVPARRGGPPRRPARHHSTGRRATSWLAATRACAWRRTRSSSGKAGCPPPPA